MKTLNKDKVKKIGLEETEVFDMILSSKQRNEEKKKEEQIFDKLQLVNNLKEVKGALGNILSSDFITAMFNEKQKVFIVEMLKNAIFARRVILMYNNQGRYAWDKEKKDWIRNKDGTYKKVELSKEEQIKVKKEADELFKSYMIEPLTLSILERNRENNFLLKLIVRGTDTEQVQEEAREEAKTIAEKITGYVNGLRGKGEET